MRRPRKGGQAQIARLRWQLGFPLRQVELYEMSFADRRKER